MASYNSSTTLKRVQYDPAPNGAVTVQAFFETTLTNASDPSDVAVKPWQQVEFTLPAELASQIAALAEAARNA